MSRFASKMKYATLNLIAPGIGQMAMKKWIRGIIQLLAALVCCGWMLVGFVKIVVGNIYRVMDGKNPETSLMDVFIPIGAVILIWGISYIDLFLFCSPPPGQHTAATRKKDNEQEKTPDDAIREEVKRQLRELGIDSSNVQQKGSVPTRNSVSEEQKEQQL